MYPLETQETSCSRPGAAIHIARALVTRVRWRLLLAYDLHQLVCFHILPNVGEFSRCAKAMQVPGGTRGSWVIRLG